MIAYPVDYHTGSFSDDIAWKLTFHLYTLNAALKEYVGHMVYDLTARHA